MSRHVGSVVVCVTADSGKVLCIMIDNVLYHERFASNLLSGILLTDKLGWKFSSSSGSGTYVVTPCGSRVTCSTGGRVAVLMGAKPERACGASDGATAAAAAGAAASTVPQRDADADALVLLHERMAHRGWTRMMHMLHSGRVLDHGIDVKKLSSSSIEGSRDAHS